MQVHPFTLAFCGPHASMEIPFKVNYFETSLRQLRITLAAAFVILGLFGLFDAVFVPEQKHLFWAIRYGIACPTTLAVLAFTFTRYAQRFMQLALGLGSLITGVAMIAMILLAPLDKQFAYLGGLVQIIYAMYTLVRFRFVWACASFSLLFMIFAICAIFFAHLPQDKSVSFIAFLFGNNFLGMIACYFIEYYTRRNFFLSQQLESKKRRLDMTNRLLERRVEKRTAEMASANQKLQIEIKERKKIETALQESKIRYGRMVNNVTDYMCVHDMNGTILEANYQMISGLAYSQAEIVGLNLMDLMTADHRATFNLYLARLARGKKAAGDVTLIAQHGQLRYMEYSSVMSKQSSGSDVVYCLARDVTERRRTDQALAESQARFKDIFNASAAGMIIACCDTGKVVEVNPAAAHMIGASVSIIVGKHLEQLICTAVEESPRAQNSTSADPVECDLMVGPRNTMPILKTMRVMEFSGRPHWLVSFISIEKVKEAEAAKREAEIQLSRAQHLQAIGTLAGGIAHDFNNILYGLIGYAQMGLDDAPEGSLLHDNLEEILRGSQRAKELIAQILTFSRQDDTERKPIRPAPLIKEALKLLRASIPSTIDIQTDIDPGAETILANPTQIHQVIMNLCTNATHALLPQGGLLKVVLGNVTVETEEPALYGSVPPGLYVRLSVTDNGVGIPRNVLNRICEPFYTTKPQGEGTGMGLAVVLGVVEVHNGAMRVNSELGKGSRFEILLPVAPPLPKNDQATDQPTPQGTEHILFVDDEKQLTQMGHQMLSKLGYEVTICQNPLEALKLFRTNPDTFDLVITDLTMPKLKGSKLAQHMLHLRPKLPIILCTGYGDQITEDQIAEIGIRELLHKPILRQNLAVTIRKALEAL